MKDEKGFSAIELIVATAIIALIGGAATGAIFQTLEGTERSNHHITCLSQVQNAGYWLSYDAQMADGVVTDDLEPEDFIVLTWTEWDYDDDSTYHSVRYFFEELSNGVGKLKRSHWSSAGANEQTLVADYIYYDPDDPDNTSKVSYQSPVLTVKLTSISGEAREAREYQIKRRPNF